MGQLTRLIENAVIDADGRRIGCVDEMILSLDTGRISHLVVKRPDCSRVCLAWTDVIVDDAQFVWKRRLTA